MERSSPETSCHSLRRSDFIRSSTGMTRSLQTIVERAIVSTITMPVPAERPPMKANSVSASRCWDIGSVSTKVSASTPAPANRMSPPIATGRTKTLMSRR